MIRKLIIIDLLTFLPILLFVSIGEILIWICVTFALGLLIVAFSYSQIRTLMRTMAENSDRKKTIQMPALAGFLVPGFGGMLLILPGLLTDLLAILVLLGSLATLITSYTSNRTSGQTSSQNQKNTRKSRPRRSSERIIDVDYQTLDESDKANKQ